MPANQNDVQMKVAIRGTHPLLMHNKRTANPLDPYTILLKKLNSKRNKTDVDYWEIAKTEWEAGLYYLPSIGPFIPSECVYACLCEGAKMIRKGSTLQGALIVEPAIIPLIYSGPRDMADLWKYKDGDEFKGGGEFRYMTPVPLGTGRSRVTVLRTRPMFREWGLEVDITLDKSLIEVPQFIEILGKAGQYKGLGDWRGRRTYGHFIAEITAGEGAMKRAA